MNYWSQADAANAILWLRRTNLLSFGGLYTPAPNRFFFCIHSMEVGSSRTQISLWGNGKMAETHAGTTPIFATRHRRRNLWHGWWGKCHISCAVIPLYLQIDALSEIVRRRRNECAPVTQRHTTGTSGGSRQPLVGFESTKGCLCYSNVEKVCGYLPQNNSPQKQTAPYAVAAVKTIVPETTSFFLSFFLFFFSPAEKIKMIFIFWSIHAVISMHQPNHLSFMCNLQLVGVHVTVRAAFGLTHGRSRECWADNQGTSCHS